MQMGRMLANCFPNRKGLERNTALFLVILWVVLCFMVLAGTKIAGRSKMSSFVRRGVVLTAGWQLPHVRLHVAARVSSQRSGWVLIWCVPSTEVKAADLWRQSPQSYSVTSNTSYWSKELHASPDPRERKQPPPFNGRSVKECAAVFNTPQSILCPRIYIPIYMKQAFPPPTHTQSFIPTMASRSAFKSRILPPKSGLRCYETIPLGFLEPFCLAETI